MRVASSYLFIGNSDLAGILSGFRVSNVVAPTSASSNWLLHIVHRSWWEWFSAKSRPAPYSVCNGHIATNRRLNLDSHEGTGTAIRMLAFVITATPLVAHKQSRMKKLLQLPIIPTI